MINELEELVTNVTNKLGYTIDTMRVIKSNRPDLCDYQCDDVFKLAKLYHKNPMEIGEEIVNELKTSDNYYFEEYTS